jgi:GNAT superfamily N-acetyltransferase
MDPARLGGKVEMNVEPFDGHHAHDAATIFVAALDGLRREVPALARDFANVGLIRDKLSSMSGSVALEGRSLVGYLTSWFPIASFRHTERVGAYVPAWGHGVAADADAAAVYRALYRALSATWASARCDVHAITLLAGDPRTIDTWFWAGFGMGTIDAVRPMDPIRLPPPVGYRVRAAGSDDVAALAILDAEHVRHYSDPPVFMTHPPADDAAAWSAFLAGNGNTAWLAEDADGPFAFIRFDRTFGGSDVTASTDGVFIRGAYARAAHRRRGAASAILDAALRHYAEGGLTCCAVDFEAFNPEAAAFWTRSFTPVCYSLMRVPETFGA